MTTQNQPTTEHLDTDEERDFRLRARSHLAQAQLPARVPGEPSFRFDDDAFVERDRRIQRTLWDGGFAGITLPVEYGGLGLSPRFDDVFVEEARPYRMPWSLGVNRNVIIPPMLAHASPELNARFIPPMLRGEHLWCQLLSEPSGGSDLAGLLTHARREADGWRLNGSKVWTTGGNQADYGACLARTNAEVPKHAGLTLFIVDMKQPGMTILPLELADRSVHFCQEYLDDVHVPEGLTIGAVDEGWRVTTTMLMHERAAIGRGWDYGKARAEGFDTLSLSTTLIDWLRTEGRASDPHVRQILGELWVLDALMPLTSKRVAAGMKSGALAGHAAAMVKLLSGTVGSRRLALLSELAGPLGVATPKHTERAELPVPLRDVGIDRVTLLSIGGGTAEMQANTVAERHLGLPREPAPDRELPFNQIRKNTVPGTRSD